MNTTTYRVEPIAFTFAMLATVSTAEAKEPGRKPVRSIKERTTTLSLDPTTGYAQLVHERTPLRDEAVFHADPQSIETNAVILFQAFSESGDSSVERWRCVATDDIAECLGAAVRIKYLPSDERVVMRLTIQNRESTAGEVLVAEAKMKNAPVLASVSK